MDMTFDFGEVRKMAATYKGGDRIVLDETRRGITRAVVLIEADAIRLVPVDTHTLQRSLTHEVTVSGRDVIGKAGTNVEYAPVVEFGRSAGAAMPPPSALVGWARRHPPGPDFKGGEASWAFVLARAIARRGIRKRPYLKPALDKNRAAITREMDQTLRRIAQRLAAGR